jgi:hypothetical protein
MLCVPRQVTLLRKTEDRLFDGIITATKGKVEAKGKLETTAFDGWVLEVFTGTQPSQSLSVGSIR